LRKFGPLLLFYSCGTLPFVQRHFIIRMHKARGGRDNGTAAAADDPVGLSGNNGIAFIACTSFM
jgi:hypothetical protein